MNYYLIFPILLCCVGLIANTNRNQEKYELLQRDQIDQTDALAIPFDDSEVEDEEEVNRREKSKVFSLPK